MVANERIGIRELRQHASRWVRRAEQGHRIEITNHGRLVAVLAPVDQDDDPLTAMERAGRVARAVDDWASPPERVVADRSSTAALQELRDRDRRR